MDRDRGDLELAPPGALVERLDVGQLVDVAQVAGVDLAFGERVEHERVVGVGTVGDVDGLAWILIGGEVKMAERAEIGCITYRLLRRLRLLRLCLELIHRRLVLQILDPLRRHLRQHSGLRNSRSARAWAAGLFCNRAAVPRIR